MLENLLRKQYFQFYNSFKSVCQKLPYSDSAVVPHLPKIKSVITEDRKRRKETFKENFVENLLLSNFQETLLEYPEINSLKEVQSLQMHHGFAKELMNISKEKINTPEKVLADIKTFELTGLRASHLINGYGYLESEFRYMQEALGLNPALTKTITENEDWGIELIKTFGNDTQKALYLPKLSNGEIMVCFAHIESQPMVSPFPISLSTTAVASPDGENYTISGKKNWVYNAKFSDLLIVSANLEKDGESKSTLFLVDKNLPGVTLHEPIKTIGMKGLDICEITFDNVVVPATSVLGGIQNGDENIKKMLMDGKLNQGPQCLALMKKLLSIAVDYSINNKMFFKNNYERTYFQEKIGFLAARLYTAESATYLVTGRLDSFHDANVFLESIIAKVYTSESLQVFLSEVLGLLGPQAYEIYFDLEDVLKDVQFFSVCDVPNDYLKLLLSQLSCKYVINYKKETSIFSKLKKILSKQNMSALSQGNHQKGLYFTEILQGYVHPMFKQESLILEAATFNLKQATEHLFSTHKKDLLDQQFKLSLLADMIVQIYVLTATLGRASRAYCLSVKHQEIDKSILHAEALRLLHRVRKNHKIIVECEEVFKNLDRLVKEVPTENSKEKDYSILQSLKVKKAARS